LSKGADEGASSEDVDLDPELRKEIRALAQKLPKMSYYELLGVELGVDDAEIRDAFFQCSRRFHPDRFFRKNLGPYGPLLTEIYKRIIAAHEVLRDPKLREGYDRTLCRTETAEPDTSPSSVAEQAGPAPPTRRAGSGSLRERSGLRSRKHLLKGLESQMKRAKSKAERHFEQAMQEKRRSNWTQAASLLKLAMAFAPRETKYRIQLEDVLPEANREHAKEQRAQARIFLEEGDAWKALELLIECSELEPMDSSLAHSVAALVIKLGGDKERGLEFSRRAVSLDENSGTYRKTLARLLRETGDREGARREFQRVWKNDPLDEEAKKELQAL
jgi:curved DNA-binding protein CbpA